MEMKRMFYPVGRGAFYCERIEVSEEQAVHIVYDCGSLNKKAELKTCIDEYSSKEFLTGDKEIEILFVSHFDKDHISGIEELVKGKNVKNIVLPYLDIEDIVLKLVYHIATEEGEEELETLIALSQGDIYSALRISPDMPGNIIYIDNNYASDDWQDSDRGIQIEVGPEDWTWDEKDIPVSDKLILREVIEQRVTVEGVVARAKELIISRPCKFLYSCEDICWSWSPFVYKYDTYHNAILTAINALIVSEGGTAGDYEFLIRRIDTLRSKIRKIYEGIIARVGKNSGVNAGSLVVYSEKGKRIAVDKNIVFRESEKKYLSLENSKTGFLYMGDYNAKSDKTYKELETFLDKHKALRGGVQVPHHGSNNNFREELLDKASFSIVSANKDEPRFPAREVLNYATRTSYLYLVTEEANTKVVQKITFKHISVKDDIIQVLEELIAKGQLTQAQVDELCTSTGEEKSILALSESYAGRDAVTCLESGELTINKYSSDYIEFSGKKYFVLNRPQAKRFEEWRKKHSL
ncbi:MAG: hypothetical protein IJF07_01560 [Lachnospiraceae bacterium]|nr:hypothetical protein [Lachnospiraceae bacterium]